MSGPTSKYISGNLGLGTNSDPYKTTLFHLILKPWEKLNFYGESNDVYGVEIWMELYENIDSLEVNGVMFYDVIDIRTQSKISYYELAGGGPLNSTHAYYAKGIGLLQMVFYINTDENDTGEGDIHKSITDYYIAPH